MRELKLKTIYKHFKGMKYITLCKSKPISLEDFMKSTMNIEPIKCIHTEHKGDVNVYRFLNGEYYHLEDECKDELVIYTALYDTFNTYAKEYDMFMSEVDKVKYPNVKQEYRFEECEYEQTGKPYDSTTENHIEYLQSCFRNGGSIKIGEAKYLVEGFSYSNCPTLEVRLNLVFKEFENIRGKDKRDFTIDELVFIQGHLGGLRVDYEEELECTLDKKRQKLLKRKVDTLNSIINKISELFCTY